jgi:hypothetical protein
MGKIPYTLVPIFQRNLLPPSSWERLRQQVLKIISIYLANYMFSHPKISIILIHPTVRTVVYPGIVFRGVQQIQLRREGRQNGDLGAAAP